jgi:hypothetical protein
MSSCPGIGASSTSETVRRLDCYIYILRAITPRSSPDANAFPNASLCDRDNARELETDDDEKRFNEKMGKIAKQKPAAEPQKKAVK